MLVRSVDLGDVMDGRVQNCDGGVLDCDGGSEVHCKQNRCETIWSALTLCEEQLADEELVKLLWSLINEFESVFALDNSELVTLV